VVAPNGISATSVGGFDAIARALAGCGQRTTECQLYAVDDEVVWTGAKPVAGAAPPPAPEQAAFHTTVAAGVTKTLGFAYAVNPDCSSRGVPTIWMVQAPQHGTARVLPRTDFAQFPAANPLSACNTKKVSGIAVDYTSTGGFVGTDTMVFEERNLENRERVFRFTILVK
jgi:hypothetical protein